MGCPPDSEWPPSVLPPWTTHPSSQSLENTPDWPRLALRHPPPPPLNQSEEGKDLVPPLRLHTMGRLYFPSNFGVLLGSSNGSRQPGNNKMATKSSFDVSGRSSSLVWNGPGKPRHQEAVVPVATQCSGCQEFALLRPAPWKVLGERDRGPGEQMCVMSPPVPGGGGRCSGQDPPEATAQRITQNSAPAAQKPHPEETKKSLVPLFH